MPPRRLLPVAVTALLGIVLIATTSIAQAGPGYSDPGSSLRAAVDATMLAERGAIARLAYQTGALGDSLVEPKREQGRWAFGTVAIPLPVRTQHTSLSSDAMPEAAIWLARRVGNTWQVTLQGTAGFNELAQSAPAAVLSDGERSALTAAPSTAVDTGLMLPWEPGVSWWMGGGPHGNGGYNRPFSSLDFSGGNGDVLAARGGYMYRFCSSNRNYGLIRVVHDNGYATDYYHMYATHTGADGTYVSRGTYLGNIGNELPCGGSSSGAHVHFALRSGSEYVAVNGKTIGGWTFYEGSSAYGGYAYRNGTYRYRGDQVTNYGASSEYPTGTVDSGSYSYVNLRSGPGLGYNIVGRAYTGDVVSIVCTARGDTVNGNWGATDLWNRLDTGSWISDGFVYTGSNDPVAPPC